MRTYQENGGHELSKHINELVERYPRMRRLYSEPLYELQQYPGGLMGIFPGCLHVVQGVCNLGDVEQPDYWRKFSAAAAAA
jgi:hypothetical protein